MENLDNFKSFVRTLPNLRNDVVAGKYSWQQLYEMYVMYGEDHEIWNKYRNNQSSASSSSIDFNAIAGMIKNIDLQALSGSLDSFQKVLGIVSTMLDKGDNGKGDEQRETSHFRRYDD